MADLATLRRAVAEAIETTGLNAHAINPGVITAPCALVEPERVDFRTAMNRGHDKWTLLVRVLVGSSSNEAGQIARDEFFGTAGDIKAAIESATDLRDGTAAQDVFVSEAHKFDSWAYSDVVYIGVEFIVEAYA